MSDYMDSVKRDEYESQLFKFSCSDFFICVKGSILDAVDGSLASLSNSILERSSEEEKPRVKDCMKQLSDAYRKAAEGPLKALAAQLPSYLSIPPHVLLPEDEVHSGNYTEKDVLSLQAEVNQLVEKLRRVEIMTQVLQNDRLRASQLKKKCELVGSISRLSKALDAIDEENTTVEDAQKVIEDILKMKVEFENLKTSDFHSSLKSRIDAENELLMQYDLK